MTRLSRFKGGYRLRCLAGCLLVAGCHSTAREHSAAVVNGDPIATEQLSAEASSNAPDTSQARNRLLDELINRKILTQEALRRGLDDQADVKLELMRARELVLANALSRNMAERSGKPSHAAIDAFVKEHPQMFADRAILVLNQLRVTAADVNADWLHPANSIDEAAGILQEHKVAFERGKSSVETGTLPPPILKYIADHPTEPFAFPQGDKLLISQVAERQAAPTPAGQVSAVATMAIQRQAVSKAIESELATRRKDGQITYGPGFSAPMR